MKILTADSGCLISKPNVDSFIYMQMYWNVLESIWNELSRTISYKLPTIPEIALIL
jgi:hypothetical protein